MADHSAERLDDDEYGYFQSSVDHRLGELAMNRLYEHIPPQVWHYVK